MIDDSFSGSYACFMYSILLLPVYKVCWNVSEALMLVICARLCSCLCIVCESNVSEALMLAIHVRFCSCLHVQILLVQVFHKPSFLLYGLCLSLSSLVPPQTVRRFIVFSGSPTAVHRAFLFLRCEGMATVTNWPLNSRALRYYTVGVPFWTS